MFIKQHHPTYKVFTGILSPTYFIFPILLKATLHHV